jgi:hypothetical protein
MDLISICVILLIQIFFLFRELLPIQGYIFSTARLWKTVETNGEAKHLLSCLLLDTPKSISFLVNLCIARYTGSIKEAQYMFGWVCFITKILIGQ